MSRGRMTFLLAASLVLLVCFAAWLVSYPLADAQYRSLIDEEVRTREAVEALLWGYCRKRIAPMDSQWGRSHVLGPEDEMISYRILCFPPNSIDMVYAPDGSVIEIYASYE